MTHFTTEEINLLCIYDAGNRVKTIRMLHDMKRHLMFDEKDLLTLTNNAIAKLKKLSNEEFDELIRVNSGDFFDGDSAVGFSSFIYDPFDLESEPE